MAADSELISQFLEGDREAFNGLVLRHRSQVFATAYRMLGNMELAEEVSQEAFIRVFKGLRSFRRRAKFSTWLYRIVMNLCYSELNRRAREMEVKPAPELGGSESPADRMADEERMMWIEREIRTLPFKQRSALVLRSFQGMSFREIGRSIGCSAGSARVNYRHAILKLKESAALSEEDM